MFCTKCGKELPDGTAFCTQCGNKLNATAPAPAAPAAPAQSRPVPQPKAGIPALPFGLSLNKFLALVLAAVCVLCLVVSYFYIMNTSFEKIPLVSWVVGDDADDLKDAKKELQQIVKNAEKDLDDIEDALTKKEFKVVKNVLSVAKKCSKSVSINNLKALAGAIKDVSKLDSSDIGVLRNIGTTVDDEVTDILGVISTVVLVAMLFALAFTACGGFLKIRGLVITGLIFSLIYGFILCGFLFVLLFAASHIALFIFIGKAKAEAAAQKAAA